jgi:DNA-binding GntR family transcriptional regulator
MSLIRTLEPAAGALPFGSTIYQRVHEHLRAEIIAGRIPPGARLKIQDLAQRYGLSHMPVREALQQLQGEGLVVLAPNRGATVRRMDAQFVRNLFGIREALEGYLTRQAATRLAPGDFDVLRSIHRDMKRARAAGDVAAVIRGNRGFHRTIEAAAGNDEALRLLSLHGELIAAIRSRFGYRPGRIATVLREHQALLDALAAGDADAAGAIHDAHIRGARDDLLDALTLAEGAPGG